MRIDLNCDAGEGAGRDADLMPHVTSVNIACGEHAGDTHIMRETLALARLHGVAAGAHPGYPDREGFGRRELDMTPGEIYEAVARQVRALCDAAREEGMRVAHVKPHGALYNAAAADSHIARAVVLAVNEVDPNLLLYGLANSRLITEAEQVGLRTVAEAFADRSYEADGTLTPRTAEGALITDADAAAARVVRMVTERAVRTRGGTELKLRADTVCIHGDGPTAVEIATAVRAALLDAGIRVAAPGAS